VYAVGHPGLSREGWWTAAVLAAGPEAVLSHRSAAELWELVRKPSPVIHVSAHAHRRIKGVIVHRPRQIDRATRNGIPVTTVHRTLVDLAATTDRGELRRALHQAQLLHSLTSPELSATPTRGRKHAAALKEPADRTRSELERRFLRLCDRHGIETPENNVRLAGLEVDFLWRRAKVVAELDGWAYHRSREAFEQDRERDQRLKRAGHDVVRFTYRQVRDEPGSVAATVRAALASAA
jgi:very-short-patch-repair endonuclease